MSIVQASACAWLESPCFNQVRMPIFTYNKHTIVLKKSESLTRLQPIDIIEGIKRIPVKNICQRYLKQINKSIIIIN